MARAYCFRCTFCELKFESSYPQEDVHFEEGESCGPVVRDYKAEAVAMGMAVLRAAH